MGQPESDRLKQYMFIPVNLNTAADADILTIPGAGNRMVREFKEYGPGRRRNSSKRRSASTSDAKEVARLWRYVVIQ